MLRALQGLAVGGDAEGQVALHGHEGEEAGFGCAAVGHYGYGVSVGDELDEMVVLARYT